MLTSKQKKCLLLFKAVIFYYHGLNDDETTLLKQYADKLEGSLELEWVLDFIQSHESNALTKAREYLKRESGVLSREERISALEEVWRANNAKGYITELEAMGMLKVAKDWGLQKEFLTLVRP